MNDYNPFDLGTPIPPGYKVTNANTMTLKTNEETIREILIEFSLEMKYQREEFREETIEKTIGKILSLRTADHQSMIEWVNSHSYDLADQILTEKVVSVSDLLSHLKGDN